MDAADRAPSPLRTRPRCYEEIESPLSLATIVDLKRYFEHRKTILQAPFDPQAEAIFTAGVTTFNTPRFDDLYRRWMKHSDEAFNSPSSPAATEALESSAGRVESFVLLRRGT